MNENETPKESRQGKISELNYRMGLVIPKELKPRIIEASKAQNRSANNWVVTIIRKALDEQGF